MEVAKTLAYFHHIPFPSPDIFAKLPWRSELLRAMVQFDVLGFQTNRDLQNFVCCLRRFLIADVHIRSSAKEVAIERKAGLSIAGAFPISIDFHEFSSRASSSEVREMAISLRRNINADHCLLGVDRLDYTKGILERLKAFALLLEKSRELHQRQRWYKSLYPAAKIYPNIGSLNRTWNAWSRQSMGALRKTAGSRSSMSIVNWAGTSYWPITRLRISL